MLGTARCTMLPPASADLEPIARLYADPRVRAFLGGAIGDVAALAASRKIVDGTGSDHAWVVCRTEDGRFCGVVMLGPHHDGQGTEISYLFDSAIWGTGMAGESVARVLGHARQDLGIWPVLAETQQANLPSRRLLARCGLHEIATLRRFGVDQVLYSTLVSDSPSRRTAG